MKEYSPYFLQGLTLGLGLSMLFGPIFVALSKAALEKGARSGLTVGLGIWTSDVIIITTTYFFVRQIAHVLEGSAFTYWLGQTGGIVLIGMGLFTFFRKVEVSLEKQSRSLIHYAGDFMNGFLVNTVNPFTFIFWIGVISTYVIGKKITGLQALVLLGTILITIITTDSLKVITVKTMKRYMKTNNITLLIKGAGILLIGFGIYLIIRTW